MAIYFYPAVLGKISDTKDNESARDFCVTRKIFIFNSRTYTESWPGSPTVVSSAKAFAKIGEYCNFFLSAAHDLLAVLGLPSEQLHLELVLPLGISFYSFKSISYIVDIFRGKGQAADNVYDLALYIAYFPQLAAGPIERADSLLTQIGKPRQITSEKVVQGCHLICLGLIKKIVIADNLAFYVNQVFTTPAATGSEVLLGTYAFAFQIYCDFSGYSDIACGLSLLLGFQPVINFRVPYFSFNPREFWGRWHITLSTWLRDYVYIPLGGNRGGVLATNRNLMLTMLLGGLWHGAAWNFILWGAFHGALLAVHRSMHRLPMLTVQAGFFAKTAWNGLRILVMFHLTCYGWLLFRATSFQQIHEMSAALLAGISFTASNHRTGSRR